MSAPDTTPSAARTRIWELSDPPQADVDGLAAALEVPPVIAGLLAQRGVPDAEGPLQEHRQILRRNERLPVLPAP